MSRDAASKLTRDGDSRVFEYIEEWKSRLIDLSRKNRLLYFKHSNRGNLSVSSPDTETVFSKLVHRKRSLEFWLPPDEQVDSQKKTRIPTIGNPEQSQKPNA